MSVSIMFTSVITSAIILVEATDVRVLKDSNCRMNHVVLVSIFNFQIMQGFSGTVISYFF